METAAFFLEKAAQCRRLADLTVNRDDHSIAALMAMAEEFEAKAAEANDSHVLQAAIEKQAASDAEEPEQAIAALKPPTDPKP